MRKQAWILKNSTGTAKIWSDLDQVFVEDFGIIMTFLLIFNSFQMVIKNESQVITGFEYDANKFMMCIRIRSATGEVANYTGYAFHSMAG